MNNDLNSLILSNAREKVAQTWEEGYESADAFYEYAHGEGYTYTLRAFEANVALIAMEELAGFLRWMFIHGYDLNESEKRYTQYLNEKKDEGE